MSGLLLNEQETFKEFYGPAHKQMAKIIEEGRIPLSAERLMKRRLEVLAASEKV